MSKIIGRFYFKLTDSKNLIGEFSNNGCDRNYTESADLDHREPEDGKFIGQYFTTWHDDESSNHIGALAKLEIKEKSGCKNIFNLKWDPVSSGQPFWGEGILCDGKLIGDYRNFETW